ncbi:hypothetical protein [Hansschlegelia sp. KR7-227]|uniref:hypothetical protein n=1 Tax=Hansschlegelia sp. KR7-227 TaxID=3400914 RepID=UPI003C000720
MTKLIGALLAASLAAGAAPASAAGPEARPFMRGNTPCGTADNVHFCLAFTPADEALKPKPISDLRVRFAAPGRALVTWQGSVFCSVSPSTPDTRGRMGESYEYYVFLGLTDDDSPYVYNAPGTQSLGEKSYLDIRARNTEARRTDFVLSASRIDMKPVTLSRLFVINRPQLATYRAVGFGDFRIANSTSFCNVNGGAMTVQYMPD